MSEVNMFPALEMAAPRDTGSFGLPHEVRKIKASRIGLTGKKKDRGSVESRQLPGLLKTVKPTIKPATRANDVSVLIGFNAANVLFDGEERAYPDNIMAMTRTMQPSSPTMTTSNLNEQADPVHTEMQQPATATAPGTANTTAPGTARSGNKDKDGDVALSKADIVVDELRNYTTLMDKFSLHNFIIYNGETLKNTPEFQSFRRQYEHEWGSLSSLIAQLEGIMQDHMVKLAVVNGPALFELASLNLGTVEKDQVLGCISNIDHIRPSLRTTIGPVEEEGGASFWQQFRAIVKMQSLIRKFLSARRVRRIRLQLMGCIRIQAHLRKKIYRKFGMDRLRADKHVLDSRWGQNQEKLRILYETYEKRAEEIAKNPLGSATAFNSRMASLEAMAEGGSSSTNIGPRLLIHVPSITCEEYLRLDMEGLVAMQNAQISCLHQLVDPEVHIVYITPVAVSAEETAYHDKFLSMLGITTLPKRLHFIQPELIHRLPQHLPLSQVFWCSPACLRKVKSHMKRIPNAILVPGSITWIERRLSNLLNLPILACEPVVVETLKSRSYVKKVFMEASVNIPIGAHDIYSSDDLYIALSRLVSSNLDVQKWKCKLNQDHNNESVIVLDTSKLPIMSQLRHEQATLFDQNNGNTSSWFSRPVQLSVRKRLVETFQKEFTKAVRICRIDIYPTFHDWHMRARRIGSVVEAEPIERLGYVDGLCYVAPTGKITMYCGVDVFKDDRYQTQSVMGPQTCIPMQALQGATEAVANHLFNKWKMIGYLTVNFQAFWDGLDEIPRLWGLGVYMGYSPTFGAMGTAALAMRPEPYIATLPVPLPIPLFAAPVPDKSKSQTVQKHHHSHSHSRDIHEKFVLHIPYATHDALKGTRNDEFFKFCNMRGISFDSNDRTGVLFFLVDGIMGGAISMMSIANSRLRALEQAVSAINFIIQQFGKGENGRNYDTLTSILLNLKKALKVEEKNAGPLNAI